MPTLEQMVEALSRQRSSRDLPMQPGATDRQIDALSAEVRETFGVDLPNRHADLLRMTNGINENSLYVFATELSRNLSSDVTGRESIIIGLVEQNKRLRGDYDHFVDVLIFSSNDQYFHVQDLVSGKYLLLPQDNSPPDEVFETYDELMIYAINTVLKPKFRPQP